MFMEALGVNDCQLLRVGKSLKWSQTSSDPNNRTEAETTGNNLNRASLILQDTWHLRHIYYSFPFADLYINSLVISARVMSQLVKPLRSCTAELSLLTQ